MVRRRRPGYLVARLPALCLRTVVAWLVALAHLLGLRRFSERAFCLARSRWPVFVDRSQVHFRYADKFLRVEKSLVHQETVDCRASSNNFRLMRDAKRADRCGRRPTIHRSHHRLTIPLADISAACRTGPKPREPVCRHRRCITWRQRSHQRLSMSLTDLDCDVSEVLGAVVAQWRNVCPLHLVVELE